MNLRTRLLMVLLMFVPLLLGGIMVSFLSALNIVAKDPIFFDGRAIKAVYETGMGQLTVSGPQGESGFTISGPVQGSFKVDASGKSTSANGTRGFTPFWLHFSNPMLVLKTEHPEYLIVDSPGLLGEPNLQYQARQEKSLIFWDETLQSQASYKYGIFNAKGRRVATGIYDSTCGLLFKMCIKNGEKPDLLLKETNFPISRNRVALIFLFMLIAVAEIFLIRKIVLPRSGRKEAMVMSISVALGIACLATDTLMDLWYPFALGTVTPMVWHCILIAILLFLGKRGGIPAIAEVAMAGALWFQLKGPAPTLAFIPGLIVAYIMSVNNVERSLKKIIKEDETSAVIVEGNLNGKS